MRFRTGAALAGVTVLALVGAGAWWMVHLASGDGLVPATDGVSLHTVALAAEVTPEEGQAPDDAASPNNAVQWLLLDGARNTADAAVAAASAAAARDRYCGADFPHAFSAGVGMDDPRNAQLAAHEKAVLAEQSRKLALAGDELARMTAAVLQFDVGRIADIAEQTTDPLIYGLALRTCSKVDVPACQSLTPSRWLQLDPGNATAMWLLASKAPTIAEARQWLARAHDASYVIVMKGRMLKRVVDSGVTDPKLLLPIANRTMGADASETAHFLSAASRVCGYSAPADPVLRSACQGYAKDAIRLETSIEERGFAGLFADHMKLPADDLPVTPAQLVETMRRYTVLRAGPAARSDDGMNCARTQYSVAFDVEAATTGDIATFQRRGGELPTPEAAEATMKRKGPPAPTGS
ncbi:hypothetical protein [Roseateles amylovorans]|uniref:Secreted protein n=1 Tax=Roseateles amylovorans TaxID=2978473 RepID=A0ABY6AUT6_9BURK|nr:hypothetical protein [Roseateles amylovorans]UXH76981.1 hypothetical protein N4261_18405 [Roseateles amylovorans]